MIQNLQKKILYPKENSSRNEEYKIKKQNSNDRYEASVETESLGYHLNKRIHTRVFKFNRIHEEDEEADNEINDSISKSLAQLLKLSKKTQKFDFNCQVYALLHHHCDFVTAPKWWRILECFISAKVSRDYPA